MAYRLRARVRPSPRGSSEIVTRESCFNLAFSARMAWVFGSPGAASTTLPSQRHCRSRPGRRRGRRRSRPRPNGRPRAAPRPRPGHLARRDDADFDGELGGRQAGFDAGSRRLVARRYPGVPDLVDGGEIAHVNEPDGGREDLALVGTASARSPSMRSTMFFICAPVGSPAASWATWPAR